MTEIVTEEEILHIAAEEEMMTMAAVGMTETVSEAEIQIGTLGDRKAM